MKTFKVFIFEEYEKNPIPVGKYSQDDMNTDHLISKIDKHLNSKKPIPSETIDVKKLVDSGKLKATQHTISHVYGGGDPVHDEVKNPSLVHHEGHYYIIDGHHRLAKAYTNNKPHKVSIFQ